MSKNKLQICLSVIFALLAVISVCFRFLWMNNEVDIKGLSSELYDKSWITGNPCSSPCWQGIEPGITSRKDALAIVEGLSFIGNSKVILHSQGASFPCKETKNGNQYCVVMSFNNNILETLWLSPNYPITFEQAVENLGLPSGFSVYPTNPGSTDCYLGIAWKEKQLVLEHIAKRPFWGDDLCEEISHNGDKIPKNLLIENVVISQPGYFERMMNYKTWKGFANNRWPQ